LRANLIVSADFFSREWTRKSANRNIGSLYSGPFARFAARFLAQLLKKSVPRQNSLRQHGAISILGILRLVRSRIAPADYAQEGRLKRNDQRNYCL
jgi:hypothetical protein